MNGGDRIASVLHSHGVKFLFTLCGGHISPILKGAKDLGIRVIDVRHEATAVFAADAVARITGIPGVAAVTAGPGATNTITAVKNAQLAQSPLILLGGAAASVLKGRGALQDIDQMALFKPHVKWATSVTRVRDLAPTMRKAFQIAQSGVPGPVFVECSVDLLYEESVIREWYAASTPQGSALPDRAVRAYLNYKTKRLFAASDVTDDTSIIDVESLHPSSSDIGRAIGRINKAERPVLVVGSQALVDSSQAGAVAAAVEQIGMPVYLSGMARGLMGSSHLLHHRHQRGKALREADLVSSACLISANRSNIDLKRNRNPDIGALADAGLFLRALSDKLEPNISARWSNWQELLLTRDAERESEIDISAGTPGELINPVSLCRSIDAELPDKSVIVADGGDFVGTASYIVKPRKPLSWLDPGVFGTLGCGAGFALGASLCRPDHEIWILFGDGSVGYALSEFDTFARHKIPVIAVVGNDACWSQIAREQVKMLHDDVGTVLERSDYQEVAAALGGKGVLLKHTDQTAACLQEARSSASKGVPVLINCWLDRTDFREGSLSM